MSVVEKTMSDGTEAIVIRGVDQVLGEGGSMLRARDLGDRLEMATQVAPGTFHTYAVISPGAARALADWLTWYADQQEEEQ
jgi:hypothetical protein